jgi:hypothetical protein
MDRVQVSDLRLSESVCAIQAAEGRQFQEELKAERKDYANFKKADESPFLTQGNSHCAVNTASYFTSRRGAFSKGWWSGGGIISINLTST